MTARDLFIVEVDNFQGVRTQIDVRDTSGTPLRAVYCIATRNETSGVLQFVDYGYETIEEARQAWPHAR